MDVFERAGFMEAMRRNNVESDREVMAVSRERDNAFSRLASANRRLEENDRKIGVVLKSHDDEVASLKAKIAELEEEKAATELKLKIEKCHSAGLLSQVEMFGKELRSVSSSSSLFNKTGKKYADGRYETLIGRFYSESFDKESKKVGLSNSEMYRVKTV